MSTACVATAGLSAPALSRTGNRAMSLDEIRDSERVMRLRAEVERLRAALHALNVSFRHIVGEENRLHAEVERLTDTLRFVRSQGGLQIVLDAIDKALGEKE